MFSALYNYINVYIYSFVFSYASKCQLNDQNILRPQFFDHNITSSEFVGEPAIAKDG